MAQTRDPGPAEEAKFGGMEDIPIATASAQDPDVGPSTVDGETPDLDMPIAAAASSPDAQALQERMMVMMARMESRLGESGNNDMMALAIMQLSQAIAAMNQNQAAIAEKQHRQAVPENKFVPLISAYNPRGDKDFPRPKLKCEMFLPWPVAPGQEEELTREEIELLNLLERGEYTIRRNDKTKIKLTVSIITKLDSDQPSRLIINHDTAFNNDYHRQMPPFTDYLRDILRQSSPKARQAAAAVISMEEEEMLIAARKFNDGTAAEKGQTVVSLGA